MTENTKPLVGKQVSNDPHKNTATCKKVNDRLRRRVKRLEREQFKTDLESGLLCAFHKFIGM